MYISQFQFNRVRRGAQRLLTSPHALHAAVLASFPDPSSTESGRVLWRLDNREHTPRLLIVSPARPDLTHLAEQAGWPTLPETWVTKPYEPLLRRIGRGQEYAFRLTANPVHHTRTAEQSRGKPIGHVTVAQQRDWLLSRQHRLGFKIREVPGAGEDPIEHNVIVRDRKLLVFRRRETQVTLRVVSYEGVLTVTDPDQFVATLCNGIGRARGYGCGLLTIAAPKA